VDGEAATPRKSKRLPPPPPDPVAYKWKGDEFVGYDWRAAKTYPLIRENYERHQRKLAIARAAKKARYARKPPPSRAGGSVEFRGWRWLCPRCGRAVQVVFWPMTRANLAVVYPADREELRRAGARAQVPWPTASMGLACARCHRVRYFSRASKDFWNELVALLSCGLLYGREVERPAWATRRRKRPYAPRPNREPAWRRLRVQELLLQGWSYKRIAAEMSIHWHTVMTHATKIYRQHAVHGRYELARKLRVPLERPVTKGEQIRARLEAGQGYGQIAREMGIGRKMVSAYASDFRRRGIVFDPRCRRSAEARKDKAPAGRQGLCRR
jgi:DNA-binding CsgD family transcriptional regulator